SPPQSLLFRVVGSVPLRRFGGRRARTLALRPALDITLPVSLGHGQGTRWNVLTNHCTRTGVGTVAHGHRRDDRVVTTDAHVIADGASGLVDPVVVDEHRGATDVAAFADVGVSDVGQMRDLGVGADV